MRNSPPSAFHAKRFYFTPWLLAANILVFAYMAWSGAGIWKPSWEVLFNWGGNLGAVTASGEWWRLVTNLFIHLGILHLAVNMWVLNGMGRMIERLLGSGVFLLIYLGSGILGGMASIYAYPTMTSAGASGAIFGLYGALFGFCIRSRQGISLKTWGSLPGNGLGLVTLNLFVIVACNFFIGFTNEGIDNMASAGGLASGFVLGYVGSQSFGRFLGDGLLARPPALVTVLWLLMASLSLTFLPSRPYAEFFTYLGESYLYGKGLPQNNEKAVYWFARSARAGMREGEYFLGLMLLEGRGIPPNGSLGTDWIIESAQQGYIPAELALGKLLVEGKQLSVNYEKALYWYRKAADAGNAEAQFLVGIGYLQGKGIAKDETQATGWFRKSAGQGNPQAQYVLAMSYFTGTGGLPKEPAQGVSWVRKAAVQGFPPAQLALGSAYLDGMGVPQDDQEASHWIKLAAEEGYPQAEYSLGRLYEDGKGVHQDGAEALRWIRSAAEKGFPDAENSLGWMYLNGIIVGQDDAQAYQWIGKAATHGHFRGLNTLAKMYSEGRGIARDDAKAVEIWQKLAEQGYEKAQFNLASMILEGRAPSSLLKEVDSLLLNSADKGFPPAQTLLALRSIEQGSSPDDGSAEKWLGRAALQNEPMAKELLAIARKPHKGRLRDNEEVELILQYLRQPA